MKATREVIPAPDPYPAVAEILGDATPGVDPLTAGGDEFVQWVAWWGADNPDAAAWRPGQPRESMIWSNTILFDDEPQARAFMARCTRPGTRLGCRTVRYSPWQHMPAETARPDTPFDL